MLILEQSRTAGSCCLTKWNCSNKFGLLVFGLGLDGMGMGSLVWLVVDPTVWRNCWSATPVGQPICRKYVTLPELRGSVSYAELNSAC